MIQFVNIENGWKGRLNYILIFWTILFAKHENAVTGAALYPEFNPEEIGPYFQGDIIGNSVKLSGRLDPKYRWTNGIINYAFEPLYPQAMKETFSHAIQHISNQTCIKFRYLENPDTSVDHIYIVAKVSISCFSFVGRKGGRQLISLPEGCHSLGTFVHELLHAVGFHHEQSRTDRDDFVEILWDNVAPGKENQFRKYDAATITSFEVPYDYHSILHYSRKAFSKDGMLDTIVPKVEGNVQIGQRKGMSEKDVAKVNRMYECEKLK